MYSQTLESAISHDRTTSKNPSCNIHRLLRHQPSVAFSGSSFGTQGEIDCGWSLTAVRNLGHPWLRRVPPESWPFGRMRGAAPCTPVNRRCCLSSPSPPAGSYFPSGIYVYRIFSFFPAGSFFISSYPFLLVFTFDLYFLFFRRLSYNGSRTSEQGQGGQG